MQIKKYATIFQKEKLQVIKNMKKTYYLLLLISLLLISCNEKISTSTNNEYLIIGTFNIEWLGDGIEDNKPRTVEDIKKIADIISSSGMEIIAVQEIENEDALQKIVSQMSNFKFKVANQSGKQKLGIIYKDYITVNEIGEYEPLSLEGKTRSGYIVEIQKNDYKLLMLNVHLKATSRFDSTEQLRIESRMMRHAQAEIISNWADSVINIAGKKELTVLGDFNCYPTKVNNRTLVPIIENENLHFLTSELRSCKNPLYWFLIDHIVVSTETLKRYSPNSVFIYDFHSMFSEEEAERISDHCPVTVEFRIK